jgi:hypothetical protein
LGKRIDPSKPARWLKRETNKQADEEKKKRWKRKQRETTVESAAEAENDCFIFVVPFYGPDDVGHLTVVSGSGTH